MDVGPPSLHGCCHHCYRSKTKRHKAVVAQPPGRHFQTIVSSICALQRQNSASICPTARTPPSPMPLRLPWGAATDAVSFPNNIRPSNANATQRSGMEPSAVHALQGRLP
ncbi:unnamed protein product [Ostreobium quekettii]|uniref:Uncharacterized protein n=1 Tax=Ostreobium quekettii TaxID=121088 RepID=A0A8S1IZ95_9CHLO|nr:unnamed protein product [Ostreobium quekettii]